MCSCKNLHIDMMGVLITVPLRDNTLNLLKEKSKQITQGRDKARQHYMNPFHNPLERGIRAAENAMGAKQDQKAT